MQEIDNLTDTLNEYCANIIRVDINRDEFYAHDTVVLEIEFLTSANFFIFQNDMEKAVNDRRNTEELHKKYPQLKQLYNEYMTMCKLCGG